MTQTNIDRREVNKQFDYQLTYRSDNIFLKHCWNCRYGVDVEGKTICVMIRQILPSNCEVNREEGVCKQYARKDHD